MSEPAQEQKREAFSSRRVFILAAIGSAVGLGNIWRFPYVAYDNGGGAFMIPYIVALLTAGLPFLMLDYGLGHRNRGSAPLSFARISRKGEPLGWWQVAICFVIAIYYAAIIGWAAVYAIFSIDKSWGSDPAAYFNTEFLESADPGLSMDFVTGLLLPLLVVWAVLLVVMALGVQKGIGMVSVIFIPILVVAFLALVIQAVFLDGAAEGLDALFSPDWGALGDTSVWIAAYGQIFFSLSVGFGVMITYSAYVSRKENMTGSGLVVGFANSGFELLAGIGVFAALGFIASSTGGDPGEAAQGGGIGLAFMAFPTIINEAPAGAALGVLFFVSLVIAGITSLISVIEVVIAAVRDKFELPRIAAVLVVVVPAALASTLLFSTTTSLFALYIIDNFINQFGNPDNPAAHIASTGPEILEQMDGKVDAVNLFTTQSAIEQNDFVALEDPKNLFLPQNVAPLINSKKATEDVKTTLNGISAKLDTEKLKKLVAQVEVDKKDAATVAKQFLEDEGLTT